MLCGCRCPVGEAMVILGADLQRLFVEILRGVTLRASRPSAITDLMSKRFECAWTVN